MGVYESNNTGAADQGFTQGQKGKLGFKVPNFTGFGNPREQGLKPTVAPPAGVYVESEVIKNGE